ncbi:hypothetical protein [Hymenobacter koreensis]|uniref:Aspartyl protease n=1 Tax=Hymenobacter koreensis TaxID=1084523 RepID=A0ABP8J8W0_9BACT
MKTLRKIVLFVLALLVAGSVGGYFYARKKFEAPANQLTVAGLPTNFSFEWEANNAVQPAVAHAAQLVPVQIPGCSRTCFLQFDTGAPYTLLYAPSIAALRARYPATRAMLQAPADTVHNFRFALGQAQVRVSRLPVLNFGAREIPADSTKPFVIGTLGTDVLEGRVLLIDYASRRLTLSNKVPDDLARRTDFVPLTFESRRVMFEANLQNEARNLLFDSGTSAYALITSQNNWKTLIQPQAPVHTQAVNSWGKTLTSYTAPTAAAMHLGAAKIPLGTVTYIEGMNLFQSLMMRFSGLGGMLGNEVFAGRTVILDVAGGRFGVVRK